MVEKDFTADVEDETDVDGGTTQAFRVGNATHHESDRKGTTLWYLFLEKVSIYPRSLLEIRWSDLPQSYHLSSSPPHSPHFASSSFNFWAS